MTYVPRGTCLACRLTLAQACRGVNVPVLCGLCELLPADAAARYAERWRPHEALGLADGEQTARGVA